MDGQPKIVKMSHRQERFVATDESSVTTCVTNVATDESSVATCVTCCDT